MNHSNTKRCIRCNLDKDLCDFPNKKASKDGKNSNCTVCYRAYQKAWLENNPDYKNTHYKNNKDRYQESYKEYSSSSKEHRKAYRKEWRKDNPHKVKSHHQKRRAATKGAVGNYTGKEWADLLVKYDNKCYYCDTPLVESHADHFIPLCKGGSNFISNIVPSCPTCNLSKGTKMPWEFKKGETDKPLDKSQHT